MDSTKRLGTKVEHKSLSMKAVVIN